MTRPLTVLIVGGYGTFGGRLAQLLADCDDLTLLIAGRSLERAQEFCSRVVDGSLMGSLASAEGFRDRRSPTATEGAHGVARARFRPIRFDRDGALEAELRKLGVDIVVDASGPFQAYADYRLVEACIACGAHYLDLADGVEFVCGIERFDEHARERGVFVLSGVSSFPVLTAAVVRLLAVGLSRVDQIIAGIAPSPYANVGLNVIRAIAGYAGKPVLLRDGPASDVDFAAQIYRSDCGGREVGGKGDRERVGYALTETRRFTIAVPGRVPLRSIEFSLVDVPDLQVLARLWPECGAIWMGAGPTPAIWHRVLRGLAWLVRFRVLLSLSFLAPLMHRAINSFGWGEHRGGMFIQIAGTDSSRSRAIRSWHLIAEGDAGPFIPSIAAEAIIRKCLRDAPPVPGARIAARELEVSDYEPLLARMPIFMGSRDDSVAESPEVPLYHCVLGRAWDDLPRTLQAMHSVTTSLVAHGRAEVIRGRGLLASLVASVMGLPRNGSDVPVEVRFAVAFASGSFSRPTIEGFFNPLDETRNSTPTIEVWHRSFANRVFSSEQFAGSGRFKHLLMERFGPLTLALAVTVEPTDTGSARLRLTVRSAAFLGIPLPSFLTPQCDASESEHAGLFHFDVALHHPLTGLIVHYRGWLVPAHATSVANRTPIN